MMAWHEMLPALGDFINKTGFPIALWIIAGIAFYKVFQKFFRKLEPIIDAHFELVTQLKDTSGRTADILEKQNEILVTNFNVHTTILNDHTEKLNQIMKINVERNEILEETKKIIPIPNGLATVAGVSNGLKR
jgi:hypothetical protein